MTDELKIKLENDNLLREFERRGLDPGPVCIPLPNDLARHNAMLRDLLAWVDAYRRCPDREKLQKGGYTFPPVEPDCDPDTDWVRFERWVTGRPTDWNLGNEMLTTEELAEMSEDEVTTAFETLCDFLESRGVVVDFADKLPPRLAYQEVAASLAEDPVPFMGPLSSVHLDACTGYCPGCVRRPWCAPGCELRWTEDEEAGHIVFTDALTPYVSPAPGSLSLMTEPDDS